MVSLWYTHCLSFDMIVLGYAVVVFVISFSIQGPNCVIDVLVKHDFDNISRVTSWQRDAIEKLWASMKERQICRKQGKSVTGKLDMNIRLWMAAGEVCQWEDQHPECCWRRTLCCAVAWLNIVMGSMITSNWMSMLSWFVPVLVRAVFCTFNTTSNNSQQEWTKIRGSCTSRIIVLDHFLSHPHLK